MTYGGLDELVGVGLGLDREGDAARSGDEGRGRRRSVALGEGLLTDPLRRRRTEFTGHGSSINGDDCSELTEREVD